jgi:hypothetical protein
VAQVDFTLEDIGQQTRQIVQEAVVGEREHTQKLINQSLNKAIVGERAHTKRLINDAIVNERGYTRQMLLDVFENFVVNNLTPGFNSIENHLVRLDGRMDRLEHEVTGIRRVVRKHSSDIAELQAAQTARA